MIQALAVILTFQLVGEVVSRALTLPLPGPVLGMVMLVVAFLLSPKLADWLRPVANGLLAHLSLLFVPAGVGVVGHLTVFGQNGIAIATVLILSTVLSITVGALVFSTVARISGAGEQGDV